jgi:hypothetical protein
MLKALGFISNMAYLSPYARGKKLRKKEKLS